jgi:hypothetical protein
MWMSIRSFQTIVLAIVLAFLVLVGAVIAANNDDWRSADPCNLAEKWSTGKDQLVTPQFRRGLASHNLSPAQIIFLSGKIENKVNPVLLLAILEDQQRMVSVPPRINDEFERRLFYAMGFAIDAQVKTRYGGFFGQLVAASFELQLCHSRNMNLAEAYQTYFPGGSLNGLKLVYAWYAWEFSKLTGVPHDGSIETLDVYVDFRGPEMTAATVQKFLEDRGSFLAQKNLFRQPPADDSIDYLNPACCN